MDLVSPQPFWPLRNGLLSVYPSLKEDVTCDVVVLGAGISGAFVAECLSREGLDIVVLDKRDVGGGSTSASTALLQYEIDMSLVELSKRIGRRDAEECYRLCHDSIDSIEAHLGRETESGMCLSTQEKCLFGLRDLRCGLAAHGMRRCPSSRLASKCLNIGTSPKWLRDSGTFRARLRWFPKSRRISTVIRCYFALGFGGNGITYSMIATDIIRDAILKRPNANARLFRFDR